MSESQKTKHSIDLSNHQNKKIKAIIAVVVLLIFGVSIFFIISHVIRLSRQPGLFQDAPLNAISFSQPIADQWSPTQARTSAIQILDLFDSHRQPDNLYPNSLICDQDDGSFSCEIPGLPNFRNGYAVLYARAAAIKATYTLDERDQERLSQIREEQWTALRRDLAAYTELLRRNPSIQNNYYNCAFLVHVSLLEGLTEQERTTLETFCFNGTFEVDFANDYPTQSAHNVHQKLAALAGAGPAFDWSQDRFIVAYQENPDFFWSVSRHAYYTTEMAVRYFWPNRLTPLTMEERQEIIQLAHFYYDIALSNFYFARNHDAPLPFTSADLLSLALATQRMIELYESQESDPALFTAFRNQLMLDFHRNYFSDLALSSMPIYQLADLSFAYNQLFLAGIISNHQNISRIISATLNHTFLTADGRHNGFFDSFEETVDGRIRASFALMDNSLLAAFIVNNYRFK